MQRSVGSCLLLKPNVGAKQTSIVPLYLSRRERVTKSCHGLFRPESSCTGFRALRRMGDTTVVMIGPCVGPLRLVAG